MFFNKKNKEEAVVNAEKERTDIKKRIKNDLKGKLKFTPEEIQEVMAIIDDEEREIEYYKSSLAKVNINNDNTETDVDFAVKKIKEAGARMAQGIKQKTYEIVLRKKQQ